MGQDLRRIAAAAALASALGLGACSDGIELNGKIFDLMGVSSSSQARSEPKMADRAPLVVPPSLSRLPDPGSGKVEAQDVASLQDPERMKAAAAAERKRLHEAYCRGEIQWKDKAFKPQDTGAPRSPYGTCGLFGDATTNINK